LARRYAGHGDGPYLVLAQYGYVGYSLALALLVLVEFIGVERNGSQRVGSDLGPMDLQPSELMKITLIMLAAYYDWLPSTSQQATWIIVPLLFIAAPAYLVLGQPDLGYDHSVGVRWWRNYVPCGCPLGLFRNCDCGCCRPVTAVLQRAAPWQMLKDYQYRH
jgi:rod shape determining protein RodA